MVICQSGGESTKTYLPLINLTSIWLVAGVNRILCLNPLRLYYELSSIIESFSVIDALPVLPFFNVDLQPPGYAPAPYHYGDGGHSVPQNPSYPTQQPLPSRPQPEAWSHTGGYGPAPQQQWQPGTQPSHSHYGSPLLPPQPPGWPGSGPAVPQYDPKVSVNTTALCVSLTFSHAVLQTVPLTPSLN